MGDIIFNTEKLSKDYGTTLALDNVNLSVKKGKIYGLIGRNGAGKTTLLRILSGLTFATSGDIELFGSSSKKNLEDERKRVGSLIENPALYFDLSAQDNLELHRRILGMPDRDGVERVLDMVGLEVSPKKKVKDFSLGMKQLLGVAKALLGDPEFLVLDEPINGIDPVGVRNFRKFLIDLNTKRGVTMLISSHILSELYQVATDFIIMHEGSIVESLTHEQLDEKCRRHILIETEDAPKAAVVLEKGLKTSNFKVLPQGKIALFDYVDNIRPVAQALFDERVLVTQITYRGENLENYFVQAIGGENHV